MDVLSSLFEWVHIPLVHSIGFALVHFLWQGMLIAGGLWVFLSLNKSLSAQTRYHACIAALLLMGLMPVSTAIQYHQGERSRPGSEGAQVNWIVAPEEVPVSAQASSTVAVSGSEASKQGAMRRHVSWQPIIFIGWCLGVAVSLVRLISSWGRLSRLKKYSRRSEDPRVASLLESIIQKMGVTKAVRLRLSDYAFQPFLVGWLKPMIILPASIVAGLPADQLEAILIHELVHVRRHDSLIALWQSCMEVLFFYNPGVKWVSHQLRVEREYSCDQEVLKWVDNKLVYAHSLYQLETYRVQASKLALGARDGKLINRISSIMHDKHVHSKKRPGSWLTLVLPVLLSCVVITACTDGQPEDLDATAQYEAAMAQILESQQARATPGIALLGIQGAVREKMEAAAEEGNACAIGMMPYFYIPQYASSYRQIDKPGEEPNYLGYEEEIHSWSKKFEEALRKKAEEGNGRAMLLLSHGHNTRWDLLQLSHMVKNDSLSQIWLQRSVDATTPEAFIWKARMSEDTEEKRALYKRAAELGNGYAYKAWALIEMETPESHFNVVDAALKANAEGIHEWLEEELDTLDEQVRLGNEESISFKQYADSLDLRERLAHMPRTPLPPGWDMFCGAKDRLQ